MAGIGRVGQAELLQTHAPLRRRHVPAVHRRQEAFAQNLLDIGAPQHGLDGPAHQARALAENGDRLLLGLRLRIEQFLLGRPAIRPQLQMLPGIDARAFFGQPLRHHPGQRQVDVVAAQQDVLAHGHAVQRQLAPRFRNRDQGEIGGAAADVHYQDQIAHLHALAPVGVALDPGIEGRLRLFEQRDILVARPGEPLPASVREPRRRTTPAPSPARAARQTARPACGNPRLRAGAPGSAGWPPPAKASPPLRARGRAAAARCGPRRNAKARIWRRTPAARRSPRRASAPAGPPRNPVRRPTAGQWCPPGNRRRRGRKGTRAAGFPRGPRPDFRAAARPADARWPGQTGPPPRRRRQKPARNWWSPNRFR